MRGKRSKLFDKLTMADTFGFAKGDKGEEMRFTHPKSTQKLHFLRPGRARWSHCCVPASCAVKSASAVF
ncbi:hypothetical protein HPP92_016457 [Vanilla planifolia]|uniref:Uncharacterized protein n=1 Tax=Vanilla planifolia TaxID=51239 RepID=A0A835UU80_VANPL|nr:hypothetical protein HPP92_016457 [Vanilla planifolia]